MFTLKSRHDGFRLLLPNDFIPDEINEKYTKILTAKHSFITKPIDFVNETIQKVQLLGFNDATIPQTQSGKVHSDEQLPLNKLRMHTGSEFSYRSEVNPLQLIDKTLNIEFRHTLGFVNYFIIFESFWYQYARTKEYDKLPNQFNVELFNNKGGIYSKIVIEKPVINGIDMLDLDYSQPIGSSSTFKVIWKYSNLDYVFLEDDPDDLRYTSENDLDYFKQISK